MYFHYHTNEKHIDTKLETNRCQQIKQDNNQCKNTITIGQKLCHIHRLIKLHLKVKPSLIRNAGMGLFAWDPSKEPNEIIFRKGDKICNYNGEILTEDQLNERYGETTAPYAIELHKKKYSDGAIVRGIGTLLNNSTKSIANVRFSINKANTDVIIVAAKIIRNKKELYVNYGKNYILNEKDVITYTGANKKDYTHLY